MQPVKKGPALQNPILAALGAGVAIAGRWAKTTHTVLAGRPALQELFGHLLALFKAAEISLHKDEEYTNLMKSVVDKLERFVTALAGTATRVRSR